MAKISIIDREEFPSTEEGFPLSSSCLLRAGSDLYSLYCSAPNSTAKMSKDWRSFLGAELQAINLEHIYREDTKETFLSKIFFVTDRGILQFCAWDRERDEAGAPAIVLHNSRMLHCDS